MDVLVILDLVVQALAALRVHLTDRSQVFVEFFKVPSAFLVSLSVMHPNFFERTNDRCRLLLHFVQFVDGEAQSLDAKMASIERSQN